MSKRSLDEDLARLEKLAFKRLERCGPLVERALEKDEFFAAMWEEIKEQFAMEKYENKRG